MSSIHLTILHEPVARDGSGPTRLATSSVPASSSDPRPVAGIEPRFAAVYGRACPPSPTSPGDFRPARPGAPHPLGIWTFACRHPRLEHQRCLAAPVQHQPSEADALRGDRTCETFEHRRYAEVVIGICTKCADHAIESLPVARSPDGGRYARALTPSNGGLFRTQDPAAIEDPRRDNPDHRAMSHTCFTQRSAATRGCSDGISKP